MTEVYDHLYLGGLNVVTEQFLKQNQIKNVVTIDIELPDIDWTALNIQHKHIQLTDEENSLLFPYFPEITDWLINAIQNKQNSLVHCRHGVSRSATIVVAVIMKLLKQTLQTTLDQIKIKHPSADPNPGFYNQLALWKILDYKIQDGHKNYRLFKFQTGCIATKELDTEYEIVAPEFGFKCGKCRKKIFDNSDLVPHGAEWWQDFASDNLCTKSYCILPKPWMELNDDVAQGKLICRCGNKLGSYTLKDYLSIKCSCGKESMRPTIQVNPARVDKYKIIHIS